ncbi:CLCA_X family protein [Alteromonas sp. 14N.309.X.WAT.G.H12]|uniref:CLCA_X family protein n=1 Tax=Alteromonas sp. 14N.309.X.WAT.G.H12 TaxID=3120824 RepID=UPI002FD1D80F
MNSSDSSTPGRLHQAFYRNGPSHRDGADVTFNDIRKLFNFSRITIGKWVTPKEQQLAANLFFDALYDLVEILQVNEAVISLNGSLALAFGSGGQKHSSAHYNSATRELALAKNAGGGALAHEWFHAFDHYIAAHAFYDLQPGSFASQAWLDNNEVRPHPLNDLLCDCFKQMFLNDQNVPGEYLLRSIEADRALKMYYYAMPQEMAARAFEACIQDNALKNAFLVQGTKKSAEARLGIYPHGNLRKQLNESLMLYFYQLGVALTKKSSQ